MLDLLICQSPYETSVTKLAHIFLPTALPPEKQGSVISLTGDGRNIRPVMARREEVRSDGEILQEISANMGVYDTVFGHGGLMQEIPDQRIRVPASGMSGKAGTVEKSRREEPFDPNVSDAFPFHLLPVPSLFGDGALIRHSPDIAALRSGLTVIMSNDEFEALGFTEKEGVEVISPFGTARAMVRSSAKVRRGTLLLRHTAGSRDGLSLLRSGHAAVPASLRKAEQ